MSVQAAEGNVRCAYKIHVYSDTGNAADGDAATQLNVETRQQLQKEHQRTKVMAHLKQVAWDSEMKNALQWTEIYDEQQQHQKWKKLCDARTRMKLRNTSQKPARHSAEPTFVMRFPPEYH